MATERFPIRIGERSRLFLRICFGVRPDRAFLELGDGPDGEVLVGFGWATFRTPLANVGGWRLEGPWKWITAIGVRVNWIHRDVSFDGSAHGGVRLDLRRPVHWFVLNVPAIYVSVDDLDAVAAALTARGIPGVDARTRRT
jgi:hypothetical protein